MRLFKKDWEFHFNKITSARDACYKHSNSSWFMQKVYYKKWSAAISKADDYIVLLKTTDGDQSKVEKMRQVWTVERDKLTTAGALLISNEFDKRKAAENKKCHVFRKTR